jgi:hypothetical protein
VLMEKRNTEASRAEHSVVPESGTAGPLVEKHFHQRPAEPQVPRDDKGEASAFMESSCCFSYSRQMSNSRS